MFVQQVKSVTGKQLFEVAHNAAHGVQTLSDPFFTASEAWEHLKFLRSVKGTEHDPLADYWSKQP